MSELLILRASCLSRSLCILYKASFSSRSFWSLSFLLRTCLSRIIWRWDSRMSSFVSLLPRSIFFPMLIMFSSLWPTWDLDYLYRGVVNACLRFPWGFGFEKWKLLWSVEVARLNWATDGVITDIIAGSLDYMDTSSGLRLTPCLLSSSRLCCQWIVFFTIVRYPTLKFRRMEAPFFDSLIIEASISSRTSWTVFVSVKHTEAIDERPRGWTRLLKRLFTSALSNLLNLPTALSVVWSIYTSQPSVAKKSSFRTTNTGCMAVLSMVCLLLTPLSFGLRDSWPFSSMGPKIAKSLISIAFRWICT